MFHRFAGGQNDKGHIDMKPFFQGERAAIAVGWIALVGGALGLSLAVIGFLNSEHTDVVARQTPAIITFDLSSYDFLTAAQGTPGWRETVEEFTDASDFQGWMRSDYANALDPRNDDLTRAIFADDYAVTFAAALARGVDLTGFDNPSDLSRRLSRTLFVTAEDTMPPLGP